MLAVAFRFLLEQSSASFRVDFFTMALSRIRLSVIDSIYIFRGFYVLGSIVELSTLCTVARHNTIPFVRDEMVYYLNKL